MNIPRYFFGTGRKRWKCVTLFVVLAIGGCIHWLANEWLFPHTPEKVDKPRNRSKLRPYLFGDSRPRLRPKTAIPKVSRPEVAILKMPEPASDASFTNLQITKPGILHYQARNTSMSIPTALPAVDVGMTSQRGLTNKPQDSKTSAFQSISYNVHMFYYPWYGTPSVDGRYLHWNHQYLPHWNPQIAKNYAKGIHRPPDDIGSNFYPELGCYSSSDSNIMEEHMRQMVTSGAGVVVVSWYPLEKADDQGIPVDGLIPKLLDAAEKFKLKITLHIEPYKDRNDRTVRDDVIYITKKYANHPAFYKYKTKHNKYLPLLYIYDSYHTKPEQWANLLKPDGSHTIRNTPYDCVMIALMVEQSHREFIEVGGFDGFYTYFAVNGFTYGSRWDTWSNLKSFAERSNAIFIPSVGPGYIDTSVRPWNAANTRSRENGRYYEKAFQAALSVRPSLISITSFNEWHEGTQIEKATPKSRPGFRYLDYSPQQSDYYLKLTRKYVEMFKKVA